MSAWRTCAKCARDLYPRLARRTEEGWACADARGCSVARTARARHVAIAEDIAWMAEHGESAIGAARRLGMRADMFERWCRQHRDLLGDAWARLRARDPWSLDPRKQVQRAGWERVA